MRYCYMSKVAVTTFFFLASLHNEGFLVPHLGSNHALAVKLQSPNHWTTREFPSVTILYMGENCFL